jgi:hypothetical protein
MSARAPIEQKQIKTGSGGTFDFRFTDWSLVGFHTVSHLTVSHSNPVNLRDCQFHSGELVTGLGPVINVTNCLFERVYLSLSPVDGNTPMLRNNLFYGGTLDLLPFGAYHSVVQDNLFDRTEIVNNSSLSSYSGYNAYVTNYNRLHATAAGDIILMSPPVYQTGALGNFYEPTNSPLINAGSGSAADAGLANYTMLTNQTPDSGTVDMGYHYPVTGNDSTGTDFWLTFFNLYDANDLSLYITSPVAATGAITYMVNGPVLTITGDTNFNGTYVLTNTPAAEVGTHANIGTNMYVNIANGALQVVSFFNGTQWVIGSYDSSVEDFTNVSYYKDVLYPRDLDGANWLNTADDSPVPAVTVACPRVPFSVPFSVAAGMVTNMPVPPGYMLITNDTVEDKGIHVTASQPVSIYGFDYLNTGSTAFTAYPTTMFGTNYCVMARAAFTDAHDFDFSTFYSELAVVGTVTNTTVSITPSATTKLSNHTNAYSINLNQGETYQIRSAYDGAFNTNDVTGTLVTSDKPIAVFAGANVSEVPQNAGDLNPLVQEQVPVDQWGTNVLAFSFAGRLNGDTYRILAVSNDTVVTITGDVITVVNENSLPWPVTTNYETLTTNLAAGTFCDIILDGPVQFQSNKPIQVAQFANGGDFDHPDTGEGDPCEILLPPTGRYLTSYAIYTVTNDDVTGDFDENYLNLIVAQSATNTTFIDNSLVAATNFIAIGSSGYYGAQIAVTNGGTHNITSSQPINVEVYGFGFFDAYGYFGGMVK